MDISELEEKIIEIVNNYDGDMPKSFLEEELRNTMNDFDEDDFYNKYNELCNNDTNSKLVDITYMGRGPEYCTTIDWLMKQNMSSLEEDCEDDAIFYETILEKIQSIYPDQKDWIDKLSRILANLTGKIMPCKHCKSDKIISITSKCSNGCRISYKGEDCDEQYAPDYLNIGGDNYIEFKYCANCGLIQGDFPIPDDNIDQYF